MVASLSPSKALEGLTITEDAVPDDELDKFRREWKQEVQAKRGAGAAPAASTSETALPAAAPGAAVVSGDVGASTKGKESVRGGERTSSAFPPRSPTKSTNAKLPSSPTKVKSPRLAAGFPTSPQRRDHRSPTATTGALPPTRSPTRRSLDIPEPAGSSSDADANKIPFRAPQVRKDRAGAIDVYASAVEAEQSGRLNDALQLYRRAFKMDDHVDKLYARVARKVAEDEKRALAAAEEAPPGVEDIVDPAQPEDQPYAFRRHVQVHPDYDRSHQTHVKTGPRLDAAGLAPESRLSLMFNALSPRPPPCKPDEEPGEPIPVGSCFHAEDESMPLPLAKLPAELLEPVFAHLDVGNLEAFASTCWRARLLTAGSGLWRRLAEKIYRPPMVPDELSARELAVRHRGEWRTTLIEEERLRMDGCYISVCHYTRAGAGEQWVAITHMITYHRFLRFYPDGHVISFLTTNHPSEVVPNLRPSLRGKGLHFGRWRLVRSDDPNFDEDEDDVPKSNHRRPARVIISDLQEPGMRDPKYEFEMDLILRETNRGRWNKLDLKTYASINLNDGETLGLSLKHQKPFYFSKVRSYNPPF